MSPTADSANATFDKLNLLLLNLSASTPLNLTSELAYKYLVRLKISLLKLLCSSSLGLSMLETLLVCNPQ